MNGREKLFKFRWNIGPKAFLTLMGVAHGRRRLSLNQLKMRGVLPNHLLFLILAALRVYVFLQHEVWRVEAQLPLMVRDSNSFGQLLESQSYGREHVLWPSLLYGLKTLGLDPVALGPWLHLAFSILLLGIIFYGLPRLPLIVRVLAGSSYFLMYEYTAITRTYGLSALLLGIFLMLEMRSRSHVLWKALTLFFLALSSNIGLVLAVALAVYLFVKHSEERMKTRVIGAAVVAIGIVISVVTALPPSDLAEAEWLLAYRDGASENLGIPHLLTASARMFLDGFLYFPTVTLSHWYEPGSWPDSQSLLSSGFLGHKVVTYFIGLIVTALALWVLWRLFRISKLIAMTMAILWGGNLLVWSMMHPGYPRHFGILVLGTLGLFALAGSRKRTSSSTWMSIIAGSILTVLSISGFWAVYAEGRDVFSQSKNLAQWMQANYPHEIPYVYPDHVGATLSLYKGGYTYSLASGTGKEISFARETAEFSKPFSAQMFSQMALKGENPLLITNFPYHAILDEGNTVVEPIQSFQPAVVPGESFWVHRIRPGSKKEPWTLKLLPFEGQFGVLETSQSGAPKSLVDFVNWPESRFDNEIGSTIEIKLRLVEAPKVDPNAFVLQLMDGKRPLRVSFFEDGFGIRHDVPRTQQGMERIDDSPAYQFTLRHEMDTTDNFHVYRFTLVRDTIEAYVDGKKVGSSPIIDDTREKRVVLGSTGTKHENATAQIGYLSYSVRGALPTQDETADETTVWTLFTDLQTLFDVHPGIWAEAGTFSVRSVVDGVLTVSTKEADTGHFSRVDPELNNEVGSTAEIRLRLLEGPRNDTNGAMFSLLDGNREAKISFFPDHIKILDQNDIKGVHWIDTRDTFRTYRIAMAEDTLGVYVDEEEVATVLLSNQVEGKQILFGDFSTEMGENMSAKVDYMAYSVKGAVGPDGVVIEKSSAEGTESWDTMKWGFTIKTTGIETDSAGTGYSIDEFDNAKGSTAEVKMKILDAPASGHDGAMFSLPDGTREGKLSFFSDRIEIRDQNDLKATHNMDTTEAFHVYRIALVKDMLKVYVDGEEVAMVTLSNQVTDKKVLFGDLSSEMDQNVNAQVEYLAYSVKGAITSGGYVMPTAPVVNVIPDSPLVGEDLVCTIITESTDPDGDAISYSYTWYRDGVLQPELTTNTVKWSNTEWGETWKCVVTPDDGILDGPPGEAQVTIDKDKVMPTAPVIDVTPNSPLASEDLVSTIITESIDPNGDAISYSYAWYKDGVLQLGLTTNTVNWANTEWGETWRSVVTPNDGILDGPPGEAQVTIDKGIWTKFSGMHVSPETEAISAWAMGGTFETKVASRGVLTLQTSGTHKGSFIHPDARFDNAIGSIAEVRMRILGVPTSGFNGAMFSLSDGSREGKLSFFSDRIEIRDQNDFKATHAMDTTDAFHVYRMTLINDTLKVYVDGEEVATVTLSNQVTGRQILFGDFSTEIDQNMHAEVEHLAYSVNGAVAPQASSK